MQVSADISALFSLEQWERVWPSLPAALKAAGCEPRSMMAWEAGMAAGPLADEYRYLHGQDPADAMIYRVIVNVTSELALPKVVNVVIGALGPRVPAMGSAEWGVTEAGPMARYVWTAGGAEG